LWSQAVPNFRGMNILTPLVSDNTIFTSPYRNGAFLYEVSKDGDGEWQVKTRWEYKGAAYMSSPVAVGGHLYVHLGNGRLDCLDIETGASRWRSHAMGDYWSMAVRGDRILTLNEAGVLRLLRADPTAYLQLDEREIADQETWGHLAVAGDTIFVRELEAIAAYRWKARE
jgi:outer membrane protein assembly factor BamB